MLDDREYLPAIHRLVPGLAQRAHGLAARELVQDQTVDLQQVGVGPEGRDQVVVPDLVEEGAGLASGSHV